HGPRSTARRAALATLPLRTRLGGTAGDLHPDRYFADKSSQLRRSTMPPRPQPIVLAPEDVRGQARQLRAAGPLARVVVADLEVWALTRDDSLRSALTDPRFIINLRAWTELPLCQVIDDNPAAV